jgi:putative transcriptional regulator
MAIIIRLDVMLALRKMRSKDLAAEIGLTEAKGVRFDTLAKICRALDCQPGDLLEFTQASTPAGK